MNSNLSMVAAHSKRPIEADIIFGTSKQAAEAVAKHGAEKVINSTIGALMDDNGELIFFQSVLNHIKNLPDSDFAAYAPIAGIPEYIEKIQEACFMNHRPNAFTAAVATPGGTGAVKHAMWNYTDLGDEILTSDWYWAPYQTIAEEHGRKIKTYNYFTKEGNMDVDAFKSAVDELLTKQERLLIVLNTPAHNPTGYSVSDSEWKEITDYLRKKSEDKNKKIILFVDVAYIDFAGTTDESRDFFKYFNDLPDNFLGLVGFSMSKGYTLYGLRCGAIICMSSVKEIADEFASVCSFSNRAAWSNGTRSAMKTLSDIYSDESLLAQVFEEREEFRHILAERNDAFMAAANEIDLKTAPFRHGFFISIPCDNPRELAEKLKEDFLYVIPLQRGVRFAPCAVSKAKCSLAPAIIKKHL